MDISFQIYLEILTIFYISIYVYFYKIFVVIFIRIYNLTIFCIIDLGLADISKCIVIKNIAIFTNLGFFEFEAYEKVQSNSNAISWGRFQRCFVYHKSSNALGCSKIYKLC